MTPRAPRYVIGVVPAVALLFFLLATPGTRASLDANEDEAPFEESESVASVADHPTEEGVVQDVSTGPETHLRTSNLRENFNLSMAFEKAEREMPSLRIQGSFKKNTGSEKAVDSTLKAAGHPLGPLKPVFGGTVNISWLVRVQIMSEQGSPVPGATVWVINGLGGVVCEVKTDENGMTPVMALMERSIVRAETLDFNPYTVIVDRGDGTYTFPMRVESDSTMVFVIQLPLADEPMGSIAYAVAAFAAIAGCLVTPLSFERSRFALFSPIIPLYSKLRKEDIVGQSTRGLILDYIVTHPGEHFGAIKKALSLSNGNAVYHLRFLEKQGLIKSRLNGIYRRFYPRNFVLPPDNGDATWVN